jgi:NTP pyrophosphatase (non-canonical NTP hydrolase)
MKTPSEYMLDCVSEEAGEIAQVRGKVARFGLHDIKPGSPKSNLDNLRAEFHDIVATYMEFCDIEGIPFDIDAGLVADKLRRVYDYKLLSYNLGIVDIRDDFVRLTECIYYDEAVLPEMLECASNLNPINLEHYGELAKEASYKPKFMTEALGKLMLCINSSQ